LVLAKMESGVAAIPAKARASQTKEPRPDPIKRLKLDTLREQGVTLSRSATQLRLETRDSVLFGRADASLTPSGQALLQRLAVLLRRHPGEISVEGHADNRPISTPRFPSNWELSSARAAAVARFLVSQGMDSRRLKVIGFGDTRPLEDNRTEAGRAANRRVSLVLELTPDEEQAASVTEHSPLM
jgi:chemotaxis protein MotB